MRLTFSFFVLACLSQVIAAPLQVSTGLAPIAKLLQDIGGERVSVTTLLPPGANPHVWEPKPRQVAQLASSSGYFAIGAGFESAWLPRFRSVRKDFPVILLDKGVQFRNEEDHDHQSHAGHGGNDERDPHIWTSARQMKVVAVNAAQALSQLDPQGSQYFSARLGALSARIDSLDRYVSARLAMPASQKVMFVYHPTYGYFAADYGFQQWSVEVDGKEPSPRSMSRLVDAGRTHKAKVIFLQPEYPHRSCDALSRELGIPVLVLDPLAPDWMTHIRSVADAIAGGR